MKERKVGFWSILLVALESYYLTLSLTILFLEAEWAIDSETMRAQGIIILVKSN